MAGTFLCLIHYRALHELRRIFRHEGPIRPKIGFICFVLLVPSSAIFTWQLCATLFSRLPSGLNVPAYAIAGTLAGAVLFYLYSIPEFLREIAFAKDRELLRWCPVSPHDLIPYRLFFGLFRIFPLLVLLWTFPAFCSRLVSAGWLHVVLLDILTVSLFSWFFLAAFLTSLELIRFSNRLGVSHHAIFALLSINLIFAALFITHYAGDPAVRTWLPSLAVKIGFSNTILQICLALCAFSGVLLYRRGVRIWPAASLCHETNRRSGHLFSPRNSTIAESQPWALIQKDLKTLVRNPEYRYALLGSSLLLVLGVLAEWKQSSIRHPPSWRRMMGGLSLIYMVPLFLSARTVTLELRMLDFYRLVFAGVGRLLDLKWKTQSIVNCVVIAVLALPYFLLVSPGAKPYEGAYFTACVLLVVPFLTLLAIALGALFPSTAQPPNPFGIRPIGAAIYVLLSVTMYSFLLNYMFLGAALYSLFLLPAAVGLYLLARRSLSVHTRRR